MTAGRSSATIRSAVAADVPSLPRVETSAGTRFRTIGLHSIADDLPPDQGRLLEHVDAGTAWVAEIADVIVGYAIASVVDGAGHLDQVSVVPEAERRGIGSALIDIVVDWSRRSGHEHITLTTFVDVPWNGPFYESLGFRYLEEASFGPELREIRANERACGLDVVARAAMWRYIDGGRGAD